MKKWLYALMIIFLIICGYECQEPEDVTGTTIPVSSSATTRKSTKPNQNELFKSSTTRETTIRDINTTTLRYTEIENNSTTTVADDVVTELGNEELPQTRDDEITSSTDINIQDEEDDLKSTEWTTTQNEYMISIKDVFEKSIDLVKDEMKGFGIIQDWLKKEKESTTADYDYTVVTDEAEVEEKEEAGDVKNTEDQTERLMENQENEDQDEETATIPMKLNRFEEQKDVLEKVDEKEETGDIKNTKDQTERLMENQENEDQDEETATIPMKLNRFEEQKDVLEKVDEKEETGDIKNTKDQTERLMENQVNEDQNEETATIPMKLNRFEEQKDDLEKVDEKEETGDIKNTKDQTERLMENQVNEDQNEETATIPMKLNRFEEPKDDLEKVDKKEETGDINNTKDQTEKLMENQENEDQDEETTTKPMELNRFEEQKDVLEKIEDDLEKLEEFEVQVNKEQNERKEIVQDIEKNLNVLEEMEDKTIVTEDEDKIGTTSMTSLTEVEEFMTTEIEVNSESNLSEEEDNMKINTTEGTSGQITNNEGTSENSRILTLVTEFTTEIYESSNTETTIPDIEEINDEMSTEIIEESSETERAEASLENTEVPIVITNMVVSEEMSETENNAEVTGTEENENGNVDDDNLTEPEVGTEGSIVDFNKQTERWEGGDEESFVTERFVENEKNNSSTEESTTVIDGPIKVSTEIVTNVPITAIIQSTSTSDSTIEETTLSILSEEDSKSEDFLIVTQTPEQRENKEKDFILSLIPVRKVDIVDEVVDEIIAELEEIEEMSTTTEDSTKILIEESLNITKTVDKLLAENDIFESKSSEDIFTDVKKLNALEESNENVEAEAVDVSKNEEGQRQVLDKDPIIKSIEEEFVTSENIDKDRKKILADYISEEDNLLNDNSNQYLDSNVKEELTREVSDFESKVSAVIRNKSDGNVCFNASGLSIKITANNITQWVPSTSFASGECTSFGAYLNFTWKWDEERNNSISFTFIGDDEEFFIEEILLITNNGAFVASQLEVYVSAETDPTVIDIFKGIQIAINHPTIQLYHHKQEFAHAPMINIDNALALQIASGGLCLFVVLIGVGIYAYRKLRSEARIFKVSLDK